MHPLTMDPGYASKLWEGPKAWLHFLFLNPQMGSDGCHKNVEAFLIIVIYKTQCTSS